MDSVECSQSSFSSSLFRDLRSSWGWEGVGGSMQSGGAPGKDN